MTSNEMYPTATREIAQKRRGLSPKPEVAFQTFGEVVFADWCSFGQDKVVDGNAMPLLHPE
jgi:hypothetical protein